MVRRLTIWSDPPIWHASSDMQAEWQPGNWHGLYAHIDRAFQPQYRDKYANAIAAIDPALMTERTKYLMKHTLVLMGLLDDAIKLYPNLTPILGDLTPELPIVLHTKPVRCYPYFNQQQILL